MGACKHLGSGGYGFPQDQQGRHLEAKQGDWQERAIGDQTYQFALIILRERGNDTKGRKINSRGAAELERDTSMGGGGEDWGSPALTEWYMGTQEGAMENVLASPFGIYEMSIDVNKEQNQARLKIRIGTAGKKESYSTLDSMTSTIDNSVGGNVKS